MAKAMKSPLELAADGLLWSIKEFGKILPSPRTSLSQQAAAFLPPRGADRTRGGRCHLAKANRTRESRGALEGSVWRRESESSIDPHGVHGKGESGNALREG